MRRLVNRGGAALLALAALAGGCAGEGTDPEVAYEAAYAKAEAGRRNLPRRRERACGRPERSLGRSPCFAGAERGHGPIRTPDRSGGRRPGRSRGATDKAAAAAALAETADLTEALAAALGEAGAGAEAAYYEAL